jgi:hypothetical protein
MNSVIEVFVKGAGRGGRHGLVTAVDNVAAFSYAHVQLYQRIATNRFRKTHTLGPNQNYRFAQIKSAEMLAIFANGKIFYRTEHSEQHIQDKDNNLKNGPPEIFNLAEHANLIYEQIYENRGRIIELVWKMQSRSKEARNDIASLA